MQPANSVTFAYCRNCKDYTIGKTISRLDLHTCPVCRSINPVVLTCYFPDSQFQLDDAGWVAVLSKMDPK